jgi:hypothetical protein
LWYWSQGKKYRAAGSEFGEDLSAKSVIVVESIFVLKISAA